MKRNYTVVEIGPELGFKRTRFNVSYSLVDGGIPILHKVIKCTSVNPDSGIQDHPRFIVSIKSALNGAVSKKQTDAI